MLVTQQLADGSPTQAWLFAKIADLLCSDRL